MSGIKKHLMAAMGLAMLSMTSEKDGLYADSNPHRFYNKDYRQTGGGVRQLREFKVNGKSVMAYSKKDALKRIGRNKNK